MTWCVDLGAAGVRTVLEREQLTDGTGRWLTQPYSLTMPADTHFAPVGAARTTDPHTSHQAAASAAADARTLRARVYALLQAHPDGLTDHQVAEKLNIQQDSAGKRRGELRDAGMIIATSQTRPSPRGRPAIVWRVT